MMMTEQSMTEYSIAMKVRDIGQILYIFWK